MIKAHGIPATDARRRPGGKWVLSLAVGFCLLVASPTWAAAAVNTDSPIGFFTGIAAPLLKVQLGLDLTNIQVFPANQYSPAVHRILQLTANLYDATTNRAFTTNPPEPYCPTVFRPLFRRTPDGSIIIAGFREVVGTELASAATAPPMVEPDGESGQVSSVPPLGTPFANLDRLEPMISGVPLVIGAKKGFPNFNEFAMQTALSVSRLLEFRRAAGNLQGPVTQTNQMYVVGLSNAFGLEAWNSYSNAYPRNLQLVVSAAMTALITNEVGDVLLSNRVNQGTIVATTNWSGWTSLSDLAGSFILPFGITNQGLFLTNSSYVPGSPGFFAPQSHIFAQDQDFYAPQWYLNLNTRLLCILVDTDANRIVDYVNLDDWEPTIDITAKLKEGEDGTSPPRSYQNPANQWKTNRLQNSTSTAVPTLGVINQILVGLSGTTDWMDFSIDPYAGNDAHQAVDSFRYNLAGYSPIYPEDAGKIFYKSNVFYAPFDPIRSIFIHTSWQANDPLVHYTLGDLLDPTVSATNRVNFISQNPPLDNLGRINSRYQPWGNQGSGGNIPPAIAANDLSAKDPGVTRSDFWDFPTNQPLGISWVGQMHRGTPWQTIFLKSTNILFRFPQVWQGLLAWQRWTGDSWLWANWQGSGQAIFDAGFTVPTNDWALVSQLVSLFNTNDLRTLASANQNTVQAWTTLLDGLTVLTNPSPGELDPISMAASSPQAGVIADGILATRSTLPGQVFLDPSAMLATPELSVNSPWLTPTNQPNDVAYEIIASQLLVKLRPDSIGSASTLGGQIQVQFTGFDGYSYAVQVSSNLVDWTVVSTNYPSNGTFIFIDAPAIIPANRFYRSALLP